MRGAACLLVVALVALFGLIVIEEVLALEGRLDLLLVDIQLEPARGPHRAERPAQALPRGRSRSRVE